MKSNHVIYGPTFFKKVPTYKLYQNIRNGNLNSTLFTFPYSECLEYEYLFKGNGEIKTRR